MKNIILALIKWSLRILVLLLSIIIITGSVWTFWVCDPDVCDRSLSEIWVGGMWIVFTVLGGFLSSFEGIVLLFLVLVLMYNLVWFLCDAFRKYTKTVFKCKK